MAGHSKWAKLKHTKGASDAKKAQVFSKLVRFITVEAKKSKGDRNAPGLRAAIEKAREANMPSDNIDRAIEKAKSGKDKDKISIIENHEHYRDSYQRMYERNKNEFNAIHNRWHSKKINAAN